MEDFAGKQLGPYRIESLIGRGGMGDVYLARHERLDRQCALKVLRPELSAQRELRERFIREAQAAARLEHPNIVTVYDAGEDDGIAYFAMQLVEGEPLSNLIRTREVSTSEATRILNDIGAALDSAHDSGMVHRDVKPANIIVTSDGTAMLTDFGIVHVRPEAQLTMTGQLLGTPAYMSPEQITGGEITPQTDIYQLAVVAYELLSGELPFRASEPAALIVAHLQEPPVPIDERVEGIPPTVSSTLNQALHKLPTERYASATAFTDALETALGGRSFEPATGRKWLQRPASRFDDTTTPRDRSGADRRFLDLRIGIAVAVGAVAIIGVLAVRSILAGDPDDDGGTSAPTATSGATETQSDQGGAEVETPAVETGGESDVTFVGTNADEPPARTEEIVASYNMIELWPPDLEGATEFEIDGIPGVRLEAPAVTVRKHTLGANLGNGSAYLEASMLSNPEFYAEICLLARINATATSGYALCVSSEAETFAYYYDESREGGLSVELLPPELRAGVNQPADWNALEIRFIDDHLWFFVNDVLIGAVTHDGPRNGEVGASAYRDGSEPHEFGWGPLATLGIE